MMTRLPVLLIAVMLLASCANQQAADKIFKEPAKLADRTHTEQLLRTLPPAQRKAVVSVYKFDDQTGQHKPNDRFSEYSRAITQGGVSILIKALMDAGNGSWFRVIERSGLDNLLQERQIIRSTRKNYTAPGRDTTADPPNIAPLLFAGVLIEGGIVSYETNLVTGGIGARYLGIGANTQHQRDIVTVYLRAVNVQTGEILLSVNTSKTIYSAAIQASVFKYVAFDEILEMETGITNNEPPQFAVRQAIELAVYSMIMEGSLKGLWAFADPRIGKQAVDYYMSRRFMAEKRPQNNYPNDRHVMEKASRHRRPAPAAAMPPRQRRPVYPPHAMPPHLSRIYAPAQLPHNAMPLPGNRMPAPNELAPSPEKRGRVNYPQIPTVSGSRIGNDLYCTQQGCFPSPPNDGYIPPAAAR